MGRGIIRTADAAAIGDAFGVQLDTSRAMLAVNLLWQEADGPGGRLR